MVALVKAIQKYEKKTYIPLIVLCIKQAMVVPKEEGSNVKAKQRARAAQQAAATSSNGERKPRPQHDEALTCPRCHSNNTKFCYYNNYNLLQPRYFCKACRRYWTQGGTLRDVPHGGGSRKNKRASSSSSSSTASSSTKMNSTMQQLMMMMPPAAATTDFPNPLPMFMPSTVAGGSSSFDEHLQVSLPFVPLTVPPSTGGLLGGNGNGMAMAFPPLQPLDAMPIMHGHGMGGPTTRQHATQLVGPLQEVGNGAASHGGLHQWPSSQYGSINDGGFAAGSSSSGVQQQVIGDDDVRDQDNKASVMRFWTNNNGAN
ncbi:hypothetical protein BS78_03G014600 [Paspalum vaginatum]|nr:hypothetical protein BS78_03G014600 [Paspalum vaginatum]